VIILAAKNFKELEALINKKIRLAMEEDLAKQARMTLKEHVVEDVYSKYEPSMYTRTGGLLQDRNIDSHMIDDNTLSVRSTREEDGRDIASVIEYGKGYSFDGLDERIGARPFHEEAKKELANGLAKESLKRGLKKQGLDVK
jgi:hypothetical protein